MLGHYSIWHLLVVLVAVIVLFAGRGSIASITDDFVRGIGWYRRGEDVSQPLAEKLLKWLTICAVVLAVGYAFAYLVTVATS